MKKILVIIIILIILLLSIIVIKGYKKSSFREKVTLQIAEFNIKERATVKKENVIYLGENIKEIDNGYYDLKILNTDNNIKIYLNKLWYKNIDSDFIQNDYLAKICREIVYRINIDSNKDELEYILYKYIKENYVEVRKSKKIEKMAFYNISILLNIEDSIPILEIKGD